MSEVGQRGEESEPAWGRMTWEGSYVGKYEQNSMAHVSENMIINIFINILSKTITKKSPAISSSYKY